MQLYWHCSVAFHGASAIIACLKTIAQHAPIARSMLQVFHQICFPVFCPVRQGHEPSTSMQMFTTFRKGPLPCLFRSDSLNHLPRTSRFDGGSYRAMTTRRRRRFWMVVIWLALVAAIASVVSFWPLVENVDDYTTWPMFRLLYFAVTGLPLLIVLLILALWMEGK
jgi:hypothetical protein